MIIDDFPNEPFWKIWLDEVEEKKYKVRLWFHAKHPHRLQSEFVRSRLVRTFQLSPDWGSLDLTKTMVLMLQEAMNDEPGIDKFIFASESCLPIRSLSEVIDTVYADGVTSSWINYRNSPNNGYSKQQQFDILHLEAGLPLPWVFKADQWILLSRFHCQLIFKFLDYLLLQDDQKSEQERQDGIVTTLRHHPIFTLFKRVRASDEMFFPTVLASLLPREEDSVDDHDDKQGIKSEDSARSGENDGDRLLVGMQRRRVTYCDWSAGARNPRTFNSITTSSLQPAIEEGCLFFRKIRFELVSRTVIDSWGELVYRDHWTEKEKVVDRVLEQILARDDRQWERERDDQYHHQGRSRARDRSRSRSRERGKHGGNRSSFSHHGIGAEQKRYGRLDRSDRRSTPHHNNYHHQNYRKPTP
eukprot:scaffold1389_cov251-Ochromonas_danica.AAC.28